MSDNLSIRNSKSLRPGIISDFQIFFLIFGTMLGYGALTISRFSTMKGGRDAWIGVLSAGIIVIVNTYLILYLQNKFPGQTIFQYIEKLWGKIMSKAVTLIFFLFSAGICGLTLVVNSFVINSWLLVHTPRYFIFSTMLILCVYTSVKGIKTLTRSISFLFLAHIVLIFLFVPPGLEIGTVRNILPFGKTPLPQLLSSALASFYSFSGYELTLLYYAFSEGSKKTARYCLFCISTIVFLFSIAVITQIFTIPHELLSKLWLPSINYVALIEVPILERLDLVFITVWVTIFYKICATYYHAGVLEMEHIFNSPGSKLFPYLVAIPVFVCAIIPQNIDELDFYMFTLSTIIVFFTLAITLFVWLHLMIFGKKGAS